MTDESLASKPFDLANWFIGIWVVTTLATGWFAMGHLGGPFWTVTTDARLEPWLSVGIPAPQ